MFAVFQRTRQELKKSTRLRYVTSLSIAAALVFAQALVYSSSSDLEAHLNFLQESKTDNDFRLLKVPSSAGEAKLILELKRSEPDSDIIAVGQHIAHVIITAKDCKFPRFRVRLVGDALVSFDLKQGSDSLKDIWSGSFDIPIEGKYAVEAEWQGCSMDETTAAPLNFPIGSLRAVGTRAILPVDDKPKEAILFADSAWISMKNESFPKYMWVDPNHYKTDEKAEYLELKNEQKQTELVVSRHGTFKEPDGFYLFNHVGNYEVVCFFGSQSMQEIWKLFVDILAELRTGQRKFKFHYHKVTDLLNPDTDWPQLEKERSRKCKHIFLSVDEFDEPLSQTEYESQLKTHVGNLVQFLGDTTFPIWLLSVNEPPVRASNCHSPTLPRTTDHPCNDVLKGLFEPGKEVFPEQVHFLDNSDLVLPRFGQDQKSILANIAMRIFVAIGKGVSDWRAQGQAAKHDGVRRNGTLYPNFELIPFNWTHPESNPKLNPLTGEWIY